MRALATRLAMLFALALVNCLVFLNAQAQADNPRNDIEATLASVGPSSTDSFVALGKRRIPLRPFRVRIDGGPSSPLAFSLDLQQPLPLSGGWPAVSPYDSSLVGASFAQWISRFGSSVPHPLSGLREYAAEQAAIWHFTSGLVLNAQTLRAADIRSRAVELAELASQRAATNSIEDQPTFIQFDETVTHADVNSVDITLSLTDSLEDTYARPQCIDVRLGSAYGLLVSGYLTEIHQNRRTSRKAAAAYAPLRNVDCLKGEDFSPITLIPSGFKSLAFTAGQPDYNTAGLKLDRDDQVTRLEAFYSGTYDPGMTFAGNGRLPYIMTAGSFTVKLHQSALLDPKAFPGATAVAETTLTREWRRVPGGLWVQLAVFVIALYVITRFFNLVDWFVKSRVSSNDDGKT